MVKVHEICIRIVQKTELRTSEVNYDSASSCSNISCIYKSWTAGFSSRFGVAYNADGLRCAVVICGICFDVDIIHDDNLCAPPYQITNGTTGRRRDLLSIRIVYMIPAASIIDIGYLPLLSYSDIGK